MLYFHVIISQICNQHLQGEYLMSQIQAAKRNEA